ncbi:MAG: trypsin-like peptidase domain-containing protein [Planctomycetota bacterium]|nr:trypsin-like peptidase domain-containing protein [Planctomycetota bacterium]
MRTRPRAPRLLLPAVALILALLPAAAGHPLAPTAQAGPDTAAASLDAAHGIEHELVRALQRVEHASVSVVGRHALRRGRTSPMVLQGAGSGVLVDWNGTWVLTNAHVVAEDGVGQDGALEVVTSDGRTYPIEVRAMDRDRDLALARLVRAPKGLRPVRLPASTGNRLDVGTWVSSSGNPFMLALDGRSAATLGIISTMRPARRGGFTKVPTVQHDAEVNPGNSGGPLWNLRGELLGINGSIATRTLDEHGGGAHYTGASFAIPVQAVRTFLTNTLGPERGATVPAGVSADGLRGIEGEYRSIVQRLMHSAVVCIPRGVDGPAGGRSSGVVAHPRGLVLSDGDAGLVFRRVRRDGVLVRERHWQNDVTVRLWKPAAKRWRSVRGRVVHRDRDLDTSLIQLLEIPRGGLPHHVPPGRSAALNVGDATLAMGSAYDPRSQGAPALTAGIVSTINPRADGYLYTSAGVNPGVNGGALVDLQGRLIGTVSSYVEAGKDSPYGFLGKAVPIDRILRSLQDVPAAKPLFTRAGPRAGGSGGRALETTTNRAGRRILPHVVSLEVERSQPVSRTVPLGGRNVTLERYRGPVSGIVAGPGGLVVTSLFNLTNVSQRVDPLWEVPTGASLDDGLDAIRSIRIRRPDGRSSEAELVGYDLRWGFALLRAKSAAGWDAGPTAAPASAFERGRFIIAAGNPFGANRRADPLLTRGILSKHHEETAPAPWRGMWQTDAGVLDGNIGGAAVDLDGRVLGMLTTWDPAQHGRNSGVGFVVPWSRIQGAIPGLLRGEKPERGMLGIYFGREARPRIDRVVEDSGAARAGVEPGDIILGVDGRRTPSIFEVLDHIGQRVAGERVRLRLQRAGKQIELTVTLGRRSI